MPNAQLTSVSKGSPWSVCNIRTDSRFAPSQWETSLQSNAVSHWLRANLESALQYDVILAQFQRPDCTSFHYVNTLRPRQNGRHFADDIFKCIFFNEYAWILLKISLKFVPEVQINNMPSLVQIMAWRRPGDKPLSEPIMVTILTHICVTQPQWVNWSQPPVGSHCLSYGIWSKLSMLYTAGVPQGAINVISRTNVISRANVHITVLHCLSLFRTICTQVCIALFNHKICI